MTFPNYGYADPPPFAPIYITDAHSAESIDKPIFWFSIYSSLYLQFTGDIPGFSSVSPTKKKSFKSGQIYRKDAHRSENDFLVINELFLWDF